MGKLGMCFVVACLLGSAWTQARAEVPKPGPEMRRFVRLYCGEWTIAGRTEHTTLGPGAPWTGTMTARPVVGKFAVVSRYEFRFDGSVPPLHAQGIFTYDTHRKCWALMHVADDGSMNQGTGKAGETWRWDMTTSNRGMSYRTKVTDTHSSDGATFVRKGEMSLDGEMWRPLFEAKFTKVKAASTGGTDDERELVRLDNMWFDAIRRSDADTIEGILLDSFTLVAPDGSVLTGPEYLTFIESGNLVLTSLTPNNLDVQVYGDTAVIVATYTSQGRLKSMDISGQYRSITTWLKRDGRWRCAAAQDTKVAGASKVERNKALVRRVMEEMRAGDWEAVRKLHSNDFIYHWSDDPNTLSPDEVGQMVSELGTAVPDLRRTIKDIVAEGDRVAIRMTFEGTHLGEFEGIPPTGKKVRFQTIGLIHIANGKVMEAWEDGDNVRFMQQFGVNLLDKP